MIDLRSDTVTQPTPEMRTLMAGAIVGDDVYREDPTVTELENVSARLVGKDAALFITSGTMGNLLGMLVSAGPGREAIVDSESHIFLYEVGGASALAQVQLRPVVTQRGILSGRDVFDSMRPDDVDEPRTCLVALENTHNRHGGVVWPVASIEEVADAAHSNGLRVHMDGARIFNAVMATGAATAEIARHADTVTFCLSKGLACPMGSLFCGSHEDIDRARRWRKMLGGGWRQAGVVAAAGLWALEHMVERLAEDHGNARTLAEGLAELPGIDIDLSRVETNIVIFYLRSKSSSDFLRLCREREVLGGGYVAGRVRFVTHYGITAEDVQKALDACTRALAG